MKMPWHVLFENRLMFKYTNIVEYKISLGNRICLFVWSANHIVFIKWADLHTCYYSSGTTSL